MKLDRRSFLALNLAIATKAAGQTQDDWQGVSRIVAVGDVHGDKDAFSAVLKMAGLIDDQERWIGGNAHLVQLGDVPARGNQTREAFDFLMRLEKEAQRGGGHVHPLIGNHDAGIIYGDLRSTLPGEYAAFAEPDSRQKLEKAWEEYAESERRANRMPSDPKALEESKAAWLESHPPGFVEHRLAFSPSGQYGEWIRRNNSVIRINDSLFLHGGISPKYVNLARTAINNKIRDELVDPKKSIPGMASEVQGPLWYRGFAESEEAPLENHLRAVLRSHGVRRIVFGHTVTRSAILPRFGGRAINVDIGLSRFYGRPPACLVLEPQSQYVLHKGTKIPLPGPGRSELLAYLKAVEAADDKPSPVEKLIREFGVK